MVKWLWEEARVQEIVGSNPNTGWTFFTLICCLNCLVNLKRLKINEKEAGDCPLKTFERRRTPFHFSDPTHPPKITPHVHHQRLFPHD